MVRDSRLPYGKTTTQALTAHFGLPRDVLENLEPPRIGKRLGNALELLSVHELPYP